MLGGGLSPGPRTSCAHSGPHWPGLLLFIIVGSGGWGRVVCLLPRVGGKSPLVSCKELGLPGSAAIH